MTRQHGDFAVPGAPTEAGTPQKRKWVRPTLEQLPRLSELTLQSPIPGGGGTGGGGSTVVP